MSTRDVLLEGGALLRAVCEWAHEIALAELQIAVAARDLAELEESQTIAIGDVFLAADLRRRLAAATARVARDIALLHLACSSWSFRPWNPPAPLTTSQPRKETAT